jgi:hypothetical protein
MALVLAFPATAVCAEAPVVSVMEEQQRKGESGQEITKPEQSQWHYGGLSASGIRSTSTFLRTTCSGIDRPPHVSTIGPQYGRHLHQKRRVGAVPVGF